MINYIKSQLLPQIRMYFHYPNKRTRELALVILKNVDDIEFLSCYEDIPTWVKSLNLGDGTKTVTRLLKDHEVTLDLLLNSNITIDHVLEILKPCNFKAGFNLKIMASIAKLRNENEIARKHALIIAQNVKAKESELATNNNKILTTPSADNDVAKKKIIHKLLLGK